MYACLCVCAWCALMSICMCACWLSGRRLFKRFILNFKTLLALDCMKGGIVPKNTV